MRDTLKSGEKVSVAAEPTPSRDRNEHLDADLVGPPRDRQRLVPATTADTELRPSSTDGGHLESV